MRDWKQKYLLKVHYFNNMCTVVCALVQFIFYGQIARETKMSHKIEFKKYPIFHF